MATPVIKPTAFQLVDCYPDQLAKLAHAQSQAHTLTDSIHSHVRTHTYIRTPPPLHYHKGHMIFIQLYCVKKFNTSLSWLTLMNSYFPPLL